jgi:peptidoglycan/xylan/chitin deacetylase (PgdA/CDA1 family)
MQDAGIEFGSHTCSHPILTRLEEEDAKREIRDSKELIESHIGRAVRHFSYPNGKRADFSPELERQVRAAGYCSAVTTLEGPLRRGESQFALSRKGITEATLLGAGGRFSKELLQVELSGFYDTLFLRRWRDRNIH